MFIHKSASARFQRLIRINSDNIAYGLSKYSDELFRRSVATTLSFPEGSSENIDNLREAATNEMPPKNTKLAAKLTNLASLKAAERQLQATGIQTNKLDPVENDTTHHDIRQAVSNVSAVMENAVAKSKLNLRNLRPKSEKEAEEPKKSKISSKRSLRAVVDMEMMKRELKQLEDPPLTAEEKRLCANRLGFEFYDVDCETLARNLLGKILVRKLENGTILKGKIVETESYLGGKDKASQTYENKLTPRNMPMYMAPGTIYIYLTYGMYHCFNISSRVPGASVFIRALEPLIGQSYMELLRNMQLKKGSKYKEITKKLRILKPHQLCNGPSKLCTALEIDKETFNEKDITKCFDLWIENSTQENKTPITIVSAPRIGIDSAGPQWAAKPLRFYIFDNACVSQRNFACEDWEGAVVLIRALAPLQGIEQMAMLRSVRYTSKHKNQPNIQKSLRSFKPHQLSNGPSKFCIAFGLNRDHNKYSVCTWKNLWIEDNTEQEYDIKIIQCPRIGIDSAGPEWMLKPLRFYIIGEQSVSKLDKIAENRFFGLTPNDKRLTNI